MKKPVLLLIACTLIVAVVVTLKSCSDKGAIKITTEKVQRRTIIETVSANGKVQPEVAVKISPDVSGEIVELNVKAGQRVEKGDLLLKIKPDIYIAMVDRMTAAVNTAKANYENAQARFTQVKAQFSSIESSFHRNKKLFDQGAISQAEFETAKANYEGAKADIEATEKNVLAGEFNVKSAEASLTEANNNLQKTSIYAPVSGTITKLNVEKGERVVGTTQMAGTEMIVISLLNEMEVRVDVNENDIVRVHLNDTALIEVDAYLNRKFKGIVTEIAHSANTSGISAEQVTNFQVRIRILSSSYADLADSTMIHLSPFRTGMSATVDIQTQTAYNAISLPIQAVTTRSDSVVKKAEKPTTEEQEDDNKIIVKNEKEEQTKRLEAKNENKPQECVFVYDESSGKVKLVAVKTGVQDNNYIEIKSGLEETQEVATGPYAAVSKLLRDDRKVTRVDKKDLFSIKSSGKSD